MDQPSPPAPGELSGAADRDRRQAERRIHDRRQMERLSVRGLLTLLLVGLALLFAAFTWWQQAELRSRLDATRLEQRRLAEASAGVRDAFAELDARAQSTLNRVGQVEALAAQVAELRNSLEELRARSGAGERAWVMAEARHLLEIANRRLALESDVHSALAALQFADERLLSLRDPALNGVRRTLALEIQSLRARSQPDIAGITARLASAEELAGRLPVLGAIAETYTPDQALRTTPPGFARAWQIIKSSFAGMVSIRRVGQDDVELVSLEEQGLRRHHLQLLLFSARLAALRGDATHYRTSVSAARSWLEQRFDMHAPSVASLHEELRALEPLVIDPELPDISRSLKLLEKFAPRAPGDA